ncbi:type III-A CRISPR-associated protein Csm6 [Mycobacterium sp. SM1]|uniref:type III-A CRISPR-associated CARF protein Csm6 n=1 Tax=Mycobacterium sp. SM1 TaxID=2816243 RepID=UPI001BCADE49|nr:type III-A CRISPR-associated CARF protein Csm6 [Mycobacterium sp. SM1]MBS4728529.1 type III-A CRISPR-associated protein Csm6 [Mycobacterium sp. SM1]
MILFSPVGAADPITALGDGPMLHIVRHYQPAVVVLFLSPQLAGYEQKDRRYTAAIQRLASAIEVRKVESAEGQVHRFDVFIPEFRAQLTRLAEEFPGQEILLNTSSGTPAMQSALVAINAFGIPATKAIQVHTPKNAMSSPGDREDPADYDLDLLWEANDDNRPGATNRCIEVSSEALGVMLERENLKQLIDSYDYAAALALIPHARLPRPAQEFIRALRCRASLDHDTSERLLENTKFKYLANAAAEYVTALDLLRRRKQWADFARAATPAIDAALKSTLAGYLREDRYLSPDGRLDREKLDREPEIRTILDHRLKAQPKHRYMYLFTKDWLKLLEEFSPESYRRLKPLGDFATRVRNTAAHEIVAIDHAKLKRDGGLSAQELLDILARETDADLTLYDRLNAEAKRLIDTAAID